MPALSTVFALSLIALAVATPLPRDHDDHDHKTARALPSMWHHGRDSPLAGLFRRDSGSLPAVGSPEWLAAYPDMYGTPSYQEADIPAAWMAAYSAAVSAGKIPVIPPTTIVSGQNPVYAAGFDPLGATVCSSTPKCRAAGDVWDAPDGIIGISFDDGPTDTSPDLYEFLQANNQQATHFMIGRNIAQRPDTFLTAFNQGGDIAVHTWSHQYSTSLNDTAIIAELGWTIQIIHDSTGGRIPKFWRPPYGDADNRIRAIAQEVFGLATIFWNQDTEDWTLSSVAPAMSDAAVAAVVANVNTWMSGPKTPGLIMLEHELDNFTVHRIFESAVFPNIAKYNWTAQSLPVLLAQPTYQNAQNDTAAISSTAALSASVDQASPSSSLSSSSSSIISPAAAPTDTKNQNAAPAPKSNGASSTRASGAGGLALGLVAALLVLTA